ncbi:MAG: efflux transporter periplasmic adaptor subunit [Acidocella sp. 20-61-6]|nr:MAG: efflux transporter periplasmic adaptor subunit [Acidocella sp. 20-61-6]
MIKRLIIMLLAVVLVFGLIFGYGTFRGIMIGKFLATLSNPPQTVSTVTATESAWQSSINSVGSVVAINGANISSEVAGIVNTINFKSGENVAAGALLATLRLNNDSAILTQLQATAKLNAITYQRDLKQLQADAVSQAQVDTDKATLDAAEAQVHAQQALIDEKQIKAPFAGTLGIRQVNIGQYLGAGTQIVTLQQLNPLFVDFYVPQQALAQVSVGQAVTVKVDTFADQTFAGKVSSINSAVDTTTRTVQVRATIDNDKLLLRPGMFATVTIDVGAPSNLITLPQTVIAYNPYGDTVYTVSHGKDASGKDKLFAHQVFVQVGNTRGDQIAIIKGIKAGDVVVTAGQLKLHNGAIVNINNDIAVSNSPHPNPPNE